MWIASNHESGIIIRNATPAAAHSLTHERGSKFEYKINPSGALWMRNQLPRRTLHNLSCEAHCVPSSERTTHKMRRRARCANALCIIAWEWNGMLCVVTRAARINQRAECFSCQGVYEYWASVALFIFLLCVRLSSKSTNCLLRFMSIHWSVEWNASLLQLHRSTRCKRRARHGQF